VTFTTEQLRAAAMALLDLGYDATETADILRAVIQRRREAEQRVRERG
jgi:Holliday junction resolvasome RuvABC DNA-binding subunit